jgi:hypothetical protein
MIKIDLFNMASDEAKIADAIRNGTFKINSKLYLKYFAKSVGQGLIVGTAVSFMIIGAFAYAKETFSPDEEETE